MTRGHVLLPEESVICGCKQENGGVLLTSDGWLAEKVPARFEGLTRLHRLLHLSKVKSLHPLEVRKQNGIARLALMASLMIAGAFWLLLLVGNSDSLWEGEDTHICADGQEIPLDLWGCGHVVTCIEVSVLRMHLYRYAQINPVPRHSVIHMAEFGYHKCWVLYYRAAQKHC